MFSKNFLLIGKKYWAVNMCNNIIINSIIPLLYTYGKMIPDTAS